MSRGFKDDNSTVKISSISDFQKRVKFVDKTISSLVNRIVSTLANVEYLSNANATDTLKFLLGASLEIAIQYNPIPRIDINQLSPGDVVECKFGTHVDGEVSGMVVHSIVCDIQEEESTVYLLPITKKILDGDARKFMLIRPPHDVSYFDPSFNGGTVLLRMGKYVRYERISDIVGKTSPKFFEDIVHRFHSSMDFSLNVPKTFEEFPDSSVVRIIPEEVHSQQENPEVPTVGEQSHLGSSNTSTSEHPLAGASPKKPREKKIPFEVYMENFMDPILSSINDPDFTIEEKVSLLLSELKFEDKLGVVHDSFEVSCEVPRVTITSILTALSKIHRCQGKEVLKEALYTSYEQWLSQHHPEILEKYPDTTVMTMLKIFSKKMK